MAAQGSYISESDIDNWVGGATEATKQEVIDRIEEWIERLTKDYFFEKKFDIFLDGNGENRLFLGLIPDILSVTAIEIAGVELSSTYWAWDKISVYLDPGGVSLEAELRWLLKQYETRGLFPRGDNYIHIKGTMGWPEKLNIDDLSGTPEPYEIITGAISGATAIIDEVQLTYLKIRGRNGTFQNEEGITGGTSEFTADVNDTDGAVNDPPLAIKQATLILVRGDNDPTEYSHFIEGQEMIGAYQYQTKVKALTGVKEADDLLRLYVRAKPMLAAV